MNEKLFNDIMYSDVLTSNGFVVDFALCTTYSLDMPTLLSVPFMLGTMGELTDETLHKPHYLLEAINRSAAKFVVFCNAGNITVPQNIKTNIYSLLEQSIVQISLGKKRSGFVNFHPKIWVLKETNPDTKECQIKIVVMSRNLSTSNDIDIVCELTGIVEDKKTSTKQLDKHIPLIHFLSWLKEKANGKSIKKNITELCNCIEHVNTFNCDDKFDDYEFFPMGIEGYNGEDTCLKSVMLDHAAEMVLISPFIDNQTINMFTDCRSNARKTLITRHSSVNDKILHMLNDGVYVVKEVMTDKTESETSVDIHEKVYFIRNCQTSRQYLFLGSTNATHNGFSRNVEFLLGLRFAPHKTSYEKFRRELIYDGKDCMFEKVTDLPPQDDDTEEIDAQLQLRQAISAIKDAKVTFITTNLYDITINCKANIADLPVFIYPLYSPALRKVLVNGVLFQNIPLASLTEFYIVEINEQTRSVVKIETVNMPHEIRNKAIFQSIINTPNKLINYINFMIADSPEAFIAEIGQDEKDFTEMNNNTEKEQQVSISLFEDMMRVAYKNPNRIKAIRDIINKVDEQIIPHSFNQMYEQFENAIKQIKRL